MNDENPTQLEDVAATPKAPADTPMGARPRTPRPVDHLCLVVHGMGQQWEGMGRFYENLAQLRKTCKETASEEFGRDSLNVRWIGVEWHSVLHRLETVDKRIKTITLPTCSILRNINNNILADVLYYFTSFHGQSLIKIVAEALNETYDKFMLRHPDFSGKISLVCHSLGGIICYDILAHQQDTPFDHRQKQNVAQDVTQPLKAHPRCTRSRKKAENHASIPPSSASSSAHGPNMHTPDQHGDFPHDTHFPIVYPKLKFKPDFLFNLGSPLPAVLVMRGQSYHSYKIPKTTRYFNLFHLYDPMAYRMEPLINPRYVEISPVLIQRPSNGRAFQFSYYQELIKAYLPDLSYLPSLPTMPAMPTMPTMPSMPAMPTMPSVRSMSISGNLPSISLASLSAVSLSSISLPRPVLPSIPILARARESLQAQLGVIYDSVLANWNGDADGAALKRKRTESNNADGGIAGDSLGSSRMLASPSENSDNGGINIGGDVGHRVKRREIRRDASGDIVWQDDLGVDSDVGETASELIQDDVMQMGCRRSPRKTRLRLIRQPVSQMARVEPSDHVRHEEVNSTPSDSSTLFHRKRQTSSPIPASLTAAVEDFAGMIRRNLLSVTSPMGRRLSLTGTAGASEKSTLSVQVDKDNTSSVVSSSTTSSDVSAVIGSEVSTISTAHNRGDGNNKLVDVVANVTEDSGINKVSYSAAATNITTTTTSTFSTTTTTTSTTTAAARLKAISSMSDLGQKLTAELIAAAKKAEEQIANSPIEDDEVDDDIVDREGDVDVDEEEKPVLFDDEEEDEEDGVYVMSNVDKGKMGQKKAGGRLSSTEATRDARLFGDIKNATAAASSAIPTASASDKNTDNPSSSTNASTKYHAPGDRIDYFVQETVIDNMVHQYLVGMKAHFSYWTSKDIMYHILSHVLGTKGGRGNDDDEDAQQ